MYTPLNHPKMTHKANNFLHSLSPKTIKIVSLFTTPYLCRHFTIKMTIFEMLKPLKTASMRIAIITIVLALAALRTGYSQSGLEGFPSTN